MSLQTRAAQLCFQRNDRAGRLFTPAFNDESSRRVYTSTFALFASPQNARPRLSCGNYIRGRIIFAKAHTRCAPSNSSSADSANKPSRRRDVTVAKYELSEKSAMYARVARKRRRWMKTSVCVCMCVCLSSLNDLLGFPIAGVQTIVVRELPVVGRYRVRRSPRETPRSSCHCRQAIAEDPCDGGGAISSERGVSIHRERERERREHGRLPSPVVEKCTYYYLIRSRRIVASARYTSA